MLLNPPPFSRLFFCCACLLLSSCDWVEKHLAKTDSPPTPQVSAIASANPTPTPIPTPTPLPTPGPWVSPIKATLVNPFGNSYAFYGFLRSGHTGVDLAAPVGTPVHAVADGVVAKVMFVPNMRYGYYIILEHDQKPYHTLYGHLSRILVKPKMRVKAGDLIGASGKSGLASFPHMHFELLDRVPIRDGAWGYRYICNRNTSWIQMLDKTKLGKVTGLTWLAANIGFLNMPQIEMHSYLRMGKNQCQEKPIAPITYFNPEPYLPKYTRAEMPDLSGKRPVSNLRPRELPHPLSSTHQP